MNPNTKIMPQNLERRICANEYLAIIPDCRAYERCISWIGPINGVKTIGCGINILRFLEEMDYNTSLAAWTEAAKGYGTPFQAIVLWFNNKSNYNPVTDPVYFKENIININTIENLTFFFNTINTILPPNSCTIVKLNRNNNPELRPPNKTPGHFILMSKDVNNILYTYEPISSGGGSCDRREYKGSISQGFFNAYQAEGYLTASTIFIHQTIHQYIPDNDDDDDLGGGGKNNEKIAIPNNIFNDFIDAVEKSEECVNKGGKTKRTKKTKKNKKNKKNKKTKGIKK
jgi:hypothetical protein